MCLEGHPEPFLLWKVPQGENAAITITVHTLEIHDKLLASVFQLSWGCEAALMEPNSPPRCYIWVLTRGRSQLDAGRLETLVFFGISCHSQGKKAGLETSGRVEFGVCCILVPKTSLGQNF